MRLRKAKRQEGDEPLYHYYAQITYNTCERCLRRHGEIFSDLTQAPPIHPGCRCSSLEIPAGELDYYRDKAERMRAKAEAELQRRELFRRAREALRNSGPDEALELFRQAAAIEVYVEEIEQLFAEDRELLRAHPELVAQLRRIFTWGYRDTLQKGKYEHMPEGMKWARERWGVNRIAELCDELQG